MVVGKIAADELSRRLPYRTGISRLSPPVLERWVVDFGLAELHDGHVLVPARKTIEIASALD
jgi:hypothetical protein